MTCSTWQRTQVPWYWGQNTFCSTRLSNSVVISLLYIVYTLSRGHLSSQRFADFVSPERARSHLTRVYFYYVDTAWVEVKLLKRKMFGFGCTPNQEPRKAFSWNKCIKSITTKVVNAKKHTVNRIKQIEQLRDIPCQDSLWKNTGEMEGKMKGRKKRIFCQLQLSPALIYYNSTTSAETKSIRQ